MFKLTIKSLPLLSLVGCLTGGLYGCKAEDADVARAQSVVTMIQEVAEKNGAAWSADVEFDGSAPELRAGYSFGINTGLRVKAHIQGNAACARQPVEDGS